MGNTFSIGSCNPAPPEEKPIVMNNDTEFPALVVVSIQFDPDDLADPDSAAPRFEMKSRAREI